FPSPTLFRSLRAPPPPGALDARELEDDEALRLPVSLERLARAAAHEEAPSEAGERARRELLVALVGGRILHLDVQDDVGGHRSSVCAARADAERGSGSDHQT